MSPYRTRQPRLDDPFERSLSGFYTRARMSPARVRVDAPDAMAVIDTAQSLALFFPLVAHWSSALAFLASVLVVFTTRIHLRVERGRVRIVRSVLGIPWWCSRRAHTEDAVSIVREDWGDELVVASRSGDPGSDIFVLSTSLHGVAPAQLEEIAAACARLLSSD